VVESSKNSELPHTLLPSITISYKTQQAHSSLEATGESRTYLEHPQDPVFRELLQFDLSVAPWNPLLAEIQSCHYEKSETFVENNHQLLFNIVVV
jgi:hypothetical protein